MPFWVFLDRLTFFQLLSLDSFCSVSQRVELEGYLDLEVTECNGYMAGSITTSSPQGAEIQSVEVVSLAASPTLEDGSFLTIFDSSDSTSILSFATSSSSDEPNRVDFRFEWRGKELRCDVVAQVDAMIRVEFEATASLLLSASSSRFSHKVRFTINFTVCKFLFLATRIYFRVFHMRIC